ncbi:MAG: methylase involved in ubiquinone/menaquinone biosynthesis [Rhodospirillales bacterium]|jgi:hypothetical protein|nr:methylase involved in ubiquinone/menaquinone biosynthesis [Rhodospirillales bacterium]
MNPMPPPTPFAFEAADGFWYARALWVAARLRLADAVGSEPTPLSAIALATGTQPDAVRRLLRALAAREIFAEAERDCFVHTPCSEQLRSDHPNSQRAFVESVIGNEHYEAWGEIETTLRTGRTAYEVRFGMPAFTHFSREPDKARLFGEAMTSTNRVVEGAVLAAHGFAPFRLAVDIGGGHGGLLRALLAHHTAAKGMVYDLPDVAAECMSRIEMDGLGDRLSAAGGDFFREVPVGADLYLLKFILHDWDDARSAVLLANIRRAIAADGRVVIVEMLLPPTPVPHPGWMMDLNMLAMTGGRERTEAEYRHLLAAAGLHLESVTPTASPVAVLQAVPI